MNQTLNIAFYQRGTPCHGESVRTRPLGGTESAMIYMAEALVERGHRVSIFNDCDNPGLHYGVFYQHFSAFEKFARKNMLDVFISIRHLLPLMVDRWAPVQIYFSPDASDQPFVHRAFDVEFSDESSRYDIGMYPLGSLQSYMDAIFCVGEWQAQTFIQKFSLVKEKVKVVSNGVYVPDFPPPPDLSQRKKQIVYASTPFRGLEFLLKYFPKIREQVPDVACAILSGMQLYGFSEADDQKMFHELYQKAKQPGVVLYGPLPKSEMADVLRESRVMTYPNTFAETFCIAALEAQASGLPIVTTRLAAMEERVTSDEDGYLITGHPSASSYEEEFICKTVRLLTDDKLWTTQSEKAREKSLEYDYSVLAKNWEKIFFELKQKEHVKKVFSPEAQSFSVLVNGYPKKIELSAKVIEKHYRKALSLMGFCCS